MEKTELKGGLRQLYQKETVFVDGGSGEELGRTSTTVKVQSKSQDDFGFLFRAGMVRAAGLPGCAPGLYMWCLVNAQNGKGYLMFSPDEKAELRELLGCQAKTLQRALAALVRVGVLARVGTGRYSLVRECGWRGKAAGRKELITENRGFNT